MIQMQRLTPERLSDILASEPKAVALLDDDMRPIGVELPLPDGMTDVTDGVGVQHKTALFGDRVGQNQYGHWLVKRATPA